MTTPDESYRLIPLTKGQFAKVSPGSYEMLSKWKWRAYWNPTSKSWYAVSVWEIDGKKSTVQMSRVILGLKREDKLLADHINHDTLDNRDENIRVVTRNQNMWNMRKRLRNKSGFKGVSFCKQTGLWRTNICINRKVINLGRHLTPELAHEAYRRAAEKLHGDYRCLQ